MIIEMFYSYSKFIFFRIHDQNYLVHFQSKDSVCLDDPYTLPLALASWKAWYLWPVSTTFCKYVISTQNTLICKISYMIINSSSTYSYLHIISKYIYLIAFYRLSDKLLCLVIDCRKFPEYSIYNDVSLDQQFMVEIKALLRKPWKKCFPNLLILYFYPVIDCLNVGHVGHWLYFVWH